jgi:hypothetical protein
MNRSPAANISYLQARHQWFSVGIFPLGLLFGLTGNHLKFLTGYTDKRYQHFKNQKH